MGWAARSACARVVVIRGGRIRREGASGRRGRPHGDGSDRQTCAGGSWHAAWRRATLGGGETGALREDYVPAHAALFLHSSLASRWMVRRPMLASCAHGLLDGGEHGGRRGRRRAQQAERTGGRRPEEG